MAAAPEPAASPTIRTALLPGSSRDREELEPWENPGWASVSRLNVIRKPKSVSAAKFIRHRSPELLAECQSRARQCRERWALTRFQRGPGRTRAAEARGARRHRHLRQRHHEQLPVHRRPVRCRVGRLRADFAVHGGDHALLLPLRLRVSLRTHAALRPNYRELLREKFSASPLRLLISPLCVSLVCWQRGWDGAAPE